MSILITLPDHDNATNCLSQWNKQKLIPAIKRRNIEYHLVEGQGVTYFHVSRMISKHNPRFLVFNGHGSINGDNICGHNNEPIISLGDNEDILNARIVHSFTCCSAKKLGKGNNANAFIGYDDVFIFWMHRTTTARPLEDKLAAPHMESALTAPYEIIKGKTVEEAYNASQKKYEEWIKEYLWNKDKYTTEELQRVLPFLIWNKGHQVLIGDNKAKL